MFAGAVREILGRVLVPQLVFGSGVSLAPLPSGSVTALSLEQLDQLAALAALLSGVL